MLLAALAAAVLIAALGAFAAEPASASHNDPGCIAEPEFCDLDHDGTGDFDDNCPDVANPGQEDADLDGTGDACEPDTDGDGVVDDNDNCPSTPGPQTNSDGDGLGDPCDPDDDNDGVGDGADNCPTTHNSNQANLDGDSLGNACDPDDDNDGYGDGSDPHPNIYPDNDADGVAQGADNCPTVHNTDQANTDGDGSGDACDLDDDNDGDYDQAWVKCDYGSGCYPNSATCTVQYEGYEFCYLVDGAPQGSVPDNCRTTANPDQANLDGDSAGDACDADDDNDGVADTTDNCPRAANANQANEDTDTQGDACDTDADNDGVADGADNCPEGVNGSQSNTDGDSLGDACDADDDNDGVADGSDNCPRDPNASQTDVDGDGRGVACDPDGDDAPGSTSTTTTTTTATSTTVTTTDGAHGTAGPGDTTAPVVALALRAQRLAAVRKKGLALSLTSSEAGTAVVDVVLAARLAKSLGMSTGKAVVVGRRSAGVASGKTILTIKLSRRARARFARVGRVALTLRVSVKDAAGNASTVTKKVTLRR